MIPEQQPPLHPERKEKVPATKLTATQYLVALVMLVLGIGLWRLQVLGAENYRVLAEQNRVRKVPMLAPRGRILDREGRLIVDNYPSVTCYLLREQIGNVQHDLPLIAEGLHMDPEQIQAILEHFRYAPKYQPIPLKQDITPDEQAFLAAHRDELPELDTIDEQRRLYPKDGFLANLIGYVGEVSEADLNNSKFAFYEPGDVVGKSGVEEAYDEVLRGTDGSRDMIVNSHGREVGVMGEEYATPGKDLRLTVDLDVQRVAEQAMDGKNGALVAMDPHTGEILAMVSRPTYDPNQFAVRLSRAYWQSVIDNPDHPLLNKAIQAQLAPGSTFKIIMSLAGLQEGVAQNLHVECNGGATFYGHFFACDKHHGPVSINNAIPYSCDTYYYTLANRLGIGTIDRYATAVGIGEKTGVDLPDEAAGLMPSERWKMKAQHDKWYAGETISVGIGQGAIQATPLQLARAIGGIASGGVLRRPHVVFPSELSPEEQGMMAETYPGSGNRTVPVAPQTWETITDGMAGVMSSPAGTGYVARLEGVDFAGKTGTAQVVGHAGGHAVAGKSAVPNAWFVGMAPRRNPDIVVAVLWEHGNWGWNSAKVASEVISAYVNKQRARQGNLLQATQEPPTPQAPEPAPEPSKAEAHPAAIAASETRATAGAGRKPDAGSAKGGF